jgi:hypothetical protein
MSCKDLTGQKFGRLIVVKRAGTDNHRNSTWLCKCVCDNEVIVNRCNLKSGNTKSCGCLNKEESSKYNTIHGKSNDRIYSIWKGIKFRCSYLKNYGGRGIKVCDEWLHNFQVFYDWALSNGYADNLSIDRIDNEGNYEPTNCRWATYRQQANNTRTNRFIIHNGETNTIAEWSRKTDINYSTLRNRIVRNRCPTNKLFEKVGV